MPFFIKNEKNARLDFEKKSKVCLLKVALLLLKKAYEASYKPFYNFFVVPLQENFSLEFLNWKL